MKNYKNMPEKIKEIIDVFLNSMGDQRRYEIKAEGEDEATIYLYDIIGYDWWAEGGVTAKQFVDDLANITAGTIHLRINSPGGDVFDARAMQTALRQHPSKVIAHIDGLAASAATYVMLGADEIEAVEGALFMIHDAWALVIGNKNDMVKMAGTLEKIDEGIASDYAAKTGQKLDKIRVWMDAETDFTAQEALDNGFIDRIYKPKATKREAEKALRDAGFTATQSKKILAEGYATVNTRDAGDTPESIGQEQEAELAAIMRRTTETLKS